MKISLESSLEGVNADLDTWEQERIIFERVMRGPFELVQLSLLSLHLISVNLSLCKCHSIYFFISLWVHCMIFICTFSSQFGYKLFLKGISGIRNKEASLFETSTHFSQITELSLQKTCTYQSIKCRKSRALPNHLKNESV